MNSRAVVTLLILWVLFLAVFLVVVVRTAREFILLSLRVLVVAVVGGAFMTWLGVAERLFTHCTCH